YPDASTFGIPLWNSDGIGSSNYSNLGASSDLLKKDNYPVTDVPSADSRIDHCQSIPVGDDRVSCWADLDKYLSSEVVPWVPWLFDNEMDIMGPRLANYQYSSALGFVSVSL